MNENIITWNIVNWITIVLMAALGFLIIAGVAQLFHHATGSGDANVAS